MLEGKMIMVTGGADGIGWACAQAYAKLGARVAILGIDDLVAARAAELGGGHLGVMCDVSRDDQVKVAVERVLGEFGGLDGVHNNAGVGVPAKPLHTTTDAEWNTIFDVNVRGMLHTTRHAFEALRRSRGSILNTSSLVGSMGQADHAAYAASKGAMNALTLSMALDYAPLGIRVNAVLPAGVWTPMLRKWNAAQPHPEAMEQYLNSIHPLGYCPEADVIADACVFLLSDKARFVTGHLMHVTGGAELGYRRS